MEIDYIETAKIIAPIIAIVISIATIILTKKNIKKQLRLGKLEEILEVLHYLNGYYNSQYHLFLDFETKSEMIKNARPLPPYLINLDKYLNSFKETVDRNTITTKISRLKILSNAYFSNSHINKNLKARILTLADIYYMMYTYVYTEGTVVRKEKDAIIPTPSQMRKFINNIENDVIVEMNLGYKGISEGIQTKYYKTHFKNDIENVK